METFKAIVDILFPGENICLFCRENKSMHSKYICTSCMELVEIVNREVDLESPYIEKVYYSLLYNKFIRGKFHDFKFRGKSYLYKAFGEMLIDTIKTKKIDDKIEAIIFVPAHRRKEALRGYNQSELLGSYIAKRLDIPLLDKHLIKTRWTIDQNRLGKMERRKNLKDSFKTIKLEDFKSKQILLVDDIITTGTTMEECGRVLLEAGVRKVYGLALTSSMKL